MTMKVLPLMPLGESLLEGDGKGVDADGDVLASVMSRTTTRGVLLDSGVTPFCERSVVEIALSGINARPAMTMFPPWA